MGVFDLVGTTCSGWLSDRIDPRKLLVWYYTLRGIALFFLPAAYDAGVPALAAFVVFYGLDWVATVPPTVKLVADRFGKERVGPVFGWVFAAHQFGGSLAAFGAGALHTWLGDYLVAFMAAGVLCLIARRAWSSASTVVQCAAAQSPHGSSASHSPLSTWSSVSIPLRWWPLVAVAALAAALRWFRIDAQSLWYDEGISAFQLTRSFPEILRAAALDTHPPLLLLDAQGLGRHCSAASELGLRSLSAVWGVLAVVLTWLLGRRLFGTRACGPGRGCCSRPRRWRVYYSQEVRMYTQVTALGLLAVYAYARRCDWLYALAAIADAVLASIWARRAGRAEPARAAVVARADAPRMAQLARRQRRRRAAPSCPGCRRSSTSRATR